MKRELMEGITPEIVAFFRAIYNPLFLVQLHAWYDMRKVKPADHLPDFAWAEDAAYCLDRPEPETGNWIF